MHLPPTSALENTMRDLSHAVRLLFSRRHASLAHRLARQTMRMSSVLVGTRDPVRSWEAPMQVDKGLGRARCLQRLTRVDESPAQGGLQASTPAPLDADDDTPACLFAATMNLSGLMALATEAHVYRLWYLAAHADHAPPEALRLFGDLRDLPAHQQLAAGARTLDKLDQRGDGGAQRVVAPSRFDLERVRPTTAPVSPAVALAGSPVH